MKNIIKIIGNILYYLGLSIVIVFAFIAIYLVYGFWIMIFCLALVTTVIGGHLKDNY